jgi:hypothetical protein
MKWLNDVLSRIFPGRGAKAEGVPVKPVPSVPSVPVKREMVEVMASSFADAKDLADYRKSGDFAKGDNGVGCWGDVTAQEEVPMCALPPDDIVAKWGSMRARDARGKKVLVRVGQREVVCVLADRMPWKANIKNGCGIDLNPGAAKVLGLRPPFKVRAAWGWV